MELVHLYIFLASIFSLYVTAIKIEENIKLKKENIILKTKLGMIDNRSDNTKKSFIEILRRKFFRRSLQWINL